MCSIVTVIKPEFVSAAALVTIGELNEIAKIDRKLFQKNSRAKTSRWTT